MISKEMPKNELVGKKCILEKAIKNKNGEGLAQGTICVITDIIRGHGVTIRTEPCQYCGQYSYMSDVDRAWLTLIP